MVSVINQAGQQLKIPDGFRDLDSFRTWLARADAPARWKIWWLAGEIWIDLSPEEVFTHNLLKTEIACRMTDLVSSAELGVFFGAGALLSHSVADIAVTPDGIFVANATLESEHVRFMDDGNGGYNEIQGSPDMVLEVVSPSSRFKDQVALNVAYHRAGITEYWLVNALENPLRFELFRRGETGYKPVRRRAGWLKSAVFGRSFRILSQRSPQGHPDYTLEIC